MVEHQVHNNADITPAGFGNERFHILHGSVQEIDIVIISNIVSVVRLGRNVEGGNPDRADSKALQVIQFGNDSLQVADAVTVGILKAPDINFIGDGFLPPFLPFGAGGAAAGAEGQNKSQGQQYC